MSAERDRFFATNQAELAKFYLADPANPYQQSGRSSGEARWVETRRCITKAIDRDGTFLDVGCANGLLLETMQVWLRQDGVEIQPYGIDFIEELVALARDRVSQGVFWTANAWSWHPPRRFTFVRTNLEYVLPEDRTEFVARQLRWVEPGGRLILCHYRDRGTDQIDTSVFLRSLGHYVIGSATAPGVSVAWTDVAP